LFLIIEGRDRIERDEDASLQQREEKRIEKGSGRRALASILSVVNRWLHSFNLYRVPFPWSVFSRLRPTLVH